MSEPASLDNLFYPLSPRLTMLLATLFTQPGAEDLSVLDFLPDDDAYQLQEKAEQLVQLDVDTRIAAVVREMRRQIEFAGLVGLEAIEPTWLLYGVKGEQPLTIGVVLAQLSASARSRILTQLPTVVRSRIPTKEDLRDVKPSVMRIVRQAFEGRFTAMPSPPGQPTNFYFRDIALLESRELIQLIRALGIEELGAAFLTIGRRKLAELCARIERQAADELMAAVKDTDPRDAMNIADAQMFLARMLVGLKRDEARGVDLKEAKLRFQRELFQKAGLFRLARTIRAERPAFVRQLAQRIPRTHGLLLHSYVARASEGPVDLPALHRLQDLVLYRLEKLAARGKVNPRFLKFTFCYWGEEEAE
ncbi:MAG: hypothetical protein IPK13_15490 [Deltaproteobacteria bacterium]|nr:hypothetical protein [Deltaproteobacteria bacterium]